MKILIITGIYPPDIGGPAQHCCRLKKELETRGNRVSVFTYGKQLSDDNENGVMRISRNSNWLLRQIKAARAIIKVGTKSDIIYVNGLDLPVFLASFFLKKPKKIMRIVRDFAWEYGQRNLNLKSSVDSFQSENKSFLLSILRKIQILTINKMDKTIVPSNYLKKIISGWSIDEKKITVLKNAYKPPDKQGGGEYKKKEHTLLTIGRFVPWKRIDGLIKMFSELSEDYKLIIIGEGPQEKYLENLISAFDLWKRVRFPGPMEENEIFEHMKSSECLLLNSTYEGLSHVLIEAQFAGLPSVVTDVGGNREVIENGFNGFLVKADEYEEFKESIVKVCENTSLKKEMRTNCIIKSSDFSWDNYLEKLLKLFEG